VEVVAVSVGSLVDDLADGFDRDTPPDRLGFAVFQTAKRFGVGRPSQHSGSNLRTRAINAVGHRQRGPVERSNDTTLQPQCR